MVLRKILLSCAALALLTGMAGSAANAQIQLSFLGGVFDFSSSGFTASGGSTTSTFDFYSNAGSVVSFNGQNVQATITLSGSLSGLATAVTVGSTSIVQQNLSGITETITATGSNGPFAPGTNLLSVSASSATLSGSGHNLTFSLAGNDIFTSDVFHVGGAQTQTLLASTDNALGLSSVSSSTTSGGITVSTGTLGSFTATAHSNVFNSGSVPEASTLMGLGSLVLGGGLLGLRRRKA